MEKINRPNFVISTSEYWTNNITDYSGSSFLWSVIRPFYMLGCTARN